MSDVKPVNPVNVCVVIEIKKFSTNSKSSKRDTPVNALSSIELMLAALFFSLGRNRNRD